MSAAPALAMTNIGKRFGSVPALRGASLHVRPGTVHALLGENGAGKTTLMRIAFGLLRADEGAMLLNDTAAHFGSPADAMAAGLGMVHQHFSLVGALTVAENVALGGQGRYRGTAAAARVRAVGATAGITIDPDVRVETLPVSTQQKVEIVKALARDARLLILDEPTAVLAPPEAEELLQWLRRFAAAGGSAVLITHKLTDALAVADDVTVLRRGTTVLRAPASELTEDAVITAMLGDQPAALAVEPRVPQPVGAPVLTLANVTVRDARGVTRLREVSCAIASGEMVGVAAVEGAGQHELLRVLAGRLAPTAGRAALPAAIGFVPEDRQRDALLLDRPLTDNVLLRGAGVARGIVDWPRAEGRTEALLAAFEVRAAGPSAIARGLSGGNQQKLVLARELDPAPAALVVENPTRGLDIRATAAVLARLQEARRAGIAVVVYSSDLDDVLALSDRVLVVHGGAVREVAVDRDAVGRAMLGAR